MLGIGIVNCPEIAEVYLRSPTKSNARRIAQLHKEVHGIDGMLGSLDLTKVVWENRPLALKGQFQGKEKCATIRLEAVADHNLWLWHHAFGFPGSLNDINIWETTPLFESMQDGTHDEFDFPFTINDEQFEMRIIWWTASTHHWLDFFPQYLTPHHALLLTLQFIKRRQEKMLSGHLVCSR
jgi:hypothetical protein